MSATFVDCHGRAWHLALLDRELHADPRNLRARVSLGRTTASYPNPSAPRTAPSRLRNVAVSSARRAAGSGAASISRR